MKGSNSDIYNSITFLSPMTQVSISFLDFYQKICQDTLAVYFFEISFIGVKSSLFNDDIKLKISTIHSRFGDSHRRSFDILQFHLSRSNDVRHYI